MNGGFLLLLMLLLSLHEEPSWWCLSERVMPPRLIYVVMFVSVCSRFYWGQHNGRRMVSLRRLLQGLWGRDLQANMQQPCACEWRQALCWRCNRRMQHASLCKYVLLECWC